MDSNNSINTILSQYREIHELEKKAGVSKWNQTRLVRVMKDGEDTLTMKQLSWLERIGAKLNIGNASAKKISKLGETTENLTSLFHKQVKSSDNLSSTRVNQQPTPLTRSECEKGMKFAYQSNNSTAFKAFLSQAKNLDPTHDTFYFLKMLAKETMEVADWQKIIRFCKTGGLFSSINKSFEIMSDSRSSKKSTLLQCAVKENLPLLTKALIAEGANINKRDENDARRTYTVLMDAIENIQPEQVEILLEAGATITSDEYTTVKLTHDNRLTEDPMNEIIGIKTLTEEEKKTLNEIKDLVSKKLHLQLQDVGEDA